MKKKFEDINWVNRENAEIVFNSSHVFNRALHLGMMDQFNDWSLTEIRVRITETLCSQFAFEAANTITKSNEKLLLHESYMSLGNNEFLKCLEVD